MRAVLVVHFCIPARMQLAGDGAFSKRIPTSKFPAYMGAFVNLCSSVHRTCMVGIGLSDGHTEALQELHLAAEAKMAGERQVKMYVVDKDGEAVWVKAKTALGVLVGALQTEPGQACNLGKLGTLVKKQTGKNWVNSFKVR